VIQEQEANTLWEQA
jgi:hypothetical protein